MAARTNPLHPKRIEEMREKIRATLLIKRLEDHSLAAKNDENLEEKVMSDSQVRAALGLLGKVLPNVSESKNEIEHSGNIGFTWQK
jgi:hypothetical protein